MNGFEVRRAHSIEEYQQAFELVYQEYVRAGYIQKPRPSRMFVSPQILLPGSCVLIITHHFKVVSTLSIVKDSEMGLPMDSVYSSELNYLRRDGRSLFEACGLATSEKYRWKNLFMFAFRECFWHAVRSGATDICIMVNPKHVAFYKKILLFEDLGPEKFYARLGVPAVALRIPLETAEERLRQAYEGMDPECNLYRFFYGPLSQGLKGATVEVKPEKKSVPHEYVLRQFLLRRPDALSEMSSKERGKVSAFYRLAVENC